MAEIKIHGLSELSAALNKKANNVSKGALGAVVRQNGSELQQKAMRNAPVRTGQLRRSITLKMQDGGLTAIVQPYMNYAPYVELGTRFMAARPFLAPALDLQAGFFKRDLRKLVGK